jgi:hypothetical protein
MVQVIHNTFWEVYIPEYYTYLCWLSFESARRLEVVYQQHESSGWHKHLPSYVRHHLARWQSQQGYTTLTIGKFEF